MIVFLGASSEFAEQQTVRIQPEHGIAAREEQDLLRTGFADGGKLSQCLFGFWQRQLQSLPEITAKFIHRDQCDFTQATNALCGMHAAELSRSWNTFV